MNKWIMKTLLAFAPLLLASCDEDGRFDTRIALAGSMALSEGIALYDQGGERIVYVKAEAKGDRIAATRTELFRASSEDRIRWIKGGPDTRNPTEIFALTVPIDERNAERTTSLNRIRVDGRPATAYGVGAAYDQIRFGPSGDLAILFRGPSEDSGESLYNPNEVAIINLAEKPSETNPVFISLPFGGRRITDVAFIEQPLSIGGASRQLAVFFVQGAVRIVDIRDPGNAGATVPLVLEGDPRVVMPVEVIARDEAGAPDARLFVRAVGSEDVYEISLTDRGDGSGRFSASINAYQAGGEPLGFLLAEDNGRPLLVILARTQDGSSRSVANVVNLNGDDVFRVEIDDSVQQAIRVGEAPDSEEIVFFGNDTSRVYFLKVDGLYREQDGNLEDIFYQDGIGETLMLENDRLLIIPGSHQDLIILDLLAKRSTRLAAPSMENWQSGQVYGDRFFFVSDRGDRIDVVDLNTEHPESLLVDDPIDSLYLLPGSGVGLVWHSTPTGRATLFRLDAPSRGGAMVVDGIWLDDFLHEKEVPR